MATINGTNGNDRINGTATADRINGHGGNDALHGRGGNDTLDGGSGADTLRGGGGNDFYLVAGPFNNQQGVQTGESADVVVDTGGFDTVIATNTGWVMGDGIENLVLRSTGSYGIWSATVEGNDLDNVIRNERTGAATIINAGGGNDTIISAADNHPDYFHFDGDYGDDYVDGGTGFASDRIEIDAQSAVTVDFRDGTIAGGGTGGAGTITFVNIEGVTTGDYDDLFTGDDGNNHFSAAGGNDTLIGGDGNDFMSGDSWHPDPGNPLPGFGDDHLDGGAGNDNMSAGAGNDYLAGGEGNDNLDGGIGQDTLLGGDGDDRLVWHAGNAVVDAGAGEDTLDIDLGNLDLTAIEDGFIGGIELIQMTDPVFAAPGWPGNPNGQTLTLDEDDIKALSPDTDTLTVWGDNRDSIRIVGDYAYEGSEDGSALHRWRVGDAVLLVDPEVAVALSGSSGDDILVGTAAADRIVGFAGNDLLDGGDGGDRLNGGEGKDTLMGGNGSDSLDGGAGNDTLDGGSGNDALKGGGGNDALLWDSADSSGVNGGAGNDFLWLNQGDLNLTQIYNGMIQNIEIVDLASSGENHLTLNQRDILDISSTTDTLRVLGGAGDSVNIVGSFSDLGVSGGYHRYKVGSATLLIDTDITDVH
jgi:Ca2+-binding RTX toxin-like protein